MAILKVCAGSLAAAIWLSPASVSAQDWPSWSSDRYDVVSLDSACAMGTTYNLSGRSPIKFNVIFDGEVALLSLNSMDWSSVEDREYPGFAYLFYNPDHSYSGGVATGNVFDHIYKGFITSFPASMLDALAASTRLIVTRDDPDGEDFTVVGDFGLQGSGAAIAALRRCADFVARRNAAKERAERRLDYIAPDPFAPEVSLPIGAGTPEAPPRPSTITNPQWASRPSPQFPERAQERGIEQGRVVLSCTVQPNGRVSDCSIVSEEPSDAGFGREALAAARRATLSPRTVDGAMPSARVTFPVTFRLAPLQPEDQNPLE